MRPEPSRLGAYWREAVRLKATLLVIWFVVGYVLAIVLAPVLNHFRFLGGPLGFWIAQNGAIYVFWLLILTYARGMDRLDRKYHLHDDAA